MRHSEFKERQKLEKRLSSAFPDRWNRLNAKERERAVNKFYEEVWTKRASVRETLANITNKGLSFGTLFLGAVLAMVAGLVVNIIDRYLLKFGVWYQTGAPVFLLISIGLFNCMFERVINDEYRDSSFLDALLDNEAVNMKDSAVE